MLASPTHLLQIRGLILLLGSAQHLLHHSTSIGALPQLHVHTSCCHQSVPAIINPLANSPDEATRARVEAKHSASANSKNSHQQPLRFAALQLLPKQHPEQKIGNKCTSCICTVLPLAPSVTPNHNTSSKTKLQKSDTTCLCWLYNTCNIRMKLTLQLTTSGQQGNAALGEVGECVRYISVILGDRMHVQTCAHAHEQTSIHPAADRRCTLLLCTTTPDGKDNDL